MLYFSDQREDLGYCGMLFLWFPNNQTNNVGLVKIGKTMLCYSVVGYIDFFELGQSPKNGIQKLVIYFACFKMKLFELFKAVFFLDKQMYQLFNTIEIQKPYALDILR